MSAAHPPQPNLDLPGPAPSGGSWRVHAGLLAAVVLLASLLVQRLVLLDFPASADEYAYLWQAQAFAAGQVTAPAPQPSEAFAFFHLGTLDGQRFSRFPPGWPLLLTSGAALGVPWLINPLLSALAVVMLYRLARTWVGEKPALAGSWLVALSPFLIFNAASYHSHPSSLLALCALGLCLEAGLRGRNGAFLAAGLSFGLAVIIRPFTGLLLGLPLLARALLRLREAVPAPGKETSLETKRWFSQRFLPRALLSFGLGGLPAALFLLAVNAAVSGQPLRLPTHLIDPSEGLGFGVHGHTPLQGLQNTLHWLLEAFSYTLFLSPALLLLARKQLGREARWLWLLLALPVVGYFFYWNPGGYRYGPRFYFEALLPFAALIGVGAKGLHRTLQTRPALRPLLLLAGLLALAVWGKQASTVHAQQAERTRLARAVADKGLETGSPPSLVILLSGAGGLAWWDLTRNPPAFAQAPVLYAHGRGAQDAALLQAYPERKAFYFRDDGKEARLWPLEAGRFETPEPDPDR